MATFPGAPPNPLGFKAELNLNGTWTDITFYVMLRDQVTLTNMGRADESGSITTSQLTLTLNNRDGRFTPKNSSGAYFPNIVRNGQIRISVNATSKTGVAYSQFRFFGEVSSWPPGYDVSQHDIYVQITASGIWRRISQANVPIGSSYTRYVKLLTGTAVPQAYWAMEDGTNTTGFVLTEGTGTNTGITSAPSFAADTASFPGSDAIPQCNGSRMRGTPSGGTPTNNVIRFALSVPAAGDGGLTAASATVLNFGTAGTIASVNVTIDTTWKLTIAGKNSGGTTLFSTQLGNALNGVPVLVSVEFTPSGGSVLWKMQVIKPGAGSALGSINGSITGSVGAVSFLTLNGNGILTDTAIGQLGLWYASVPSITAAATAIGGNAGETAVARFQRLCTESNIVSTVIGSASATMGPQVDDTLANIFQGIENTDGGLLYETRDQFGLGYRTLASMKDQAAAVTMAYTSGALGAVPAPTYDDQLIRNQWTVTNFDGYAALALLTSGAMSVQAPPNGVGAGYSGSMAVNASSDSQANTIAQQKLFQGCVDDVRFPVLTVNFLRTAAAPFFASVPGLRIGDYLSLTSLPSFLGGGTAKQLIWGYTELFGGNPEGWAIEFNTVPELPFESTFNPGTFSVTQASSGAVAAGSGVGSTVSGSQVAGLPGSSLAAGTISARSVGGITQFISSATPFNWTFTVSGTPTDATYFICTQAQAQNITVGDTFTNNGGHGGPFTVTATTAVAGGNTNVYFTPDASSVMSSGTVFGGKNGDQWVNTSAGNQVNQWNAGAWTSITWNATNVITAGSITATQIAAGTITASQIAAGIVIAGIVDATTITGAKIVATGSAGEFLAYSGTPALGNLVASVSGNTGSDSFGNAYATGVEIQTGGLILANQGSAPSAVTGASLFYSSGGGRPRYLAQSGADLVLERSGVSTVQFNQGNVITAQPMSGILAYIANEAQISSEYEIEIFGLLTIANAFASTQILDWRLYMDGVNFGGGYTIGATTWQVTATNNQPYSYSIRWTVTVQSTGASGAVHIHSDGDFVATANKNQDDTFGVGGDADNVTFDSTSSHNWQLRAFWNGGTGSTAAGQAITTYRTKLVRRN